MICTHVLDKGVMECAARQMGSMSIHTDCIIIVRLP